MLRFFTYPHQLTAELRKLGYQNEDIPLTREWIGLIHEFRKRGFPPERAASIIDRAFSGEPEALADACAIAGSYAVAVFGSL